MKIKIINDFRTFIEMLLATILSEKTNYILYYYYEHFKHRKFPKYPNFSKPKTFNEKIIWLKLNKLYNNAYILADKYLVRDYIKDKIGDKYLIPLIGVFSNSKEINFNSLPNSFVLKTNHGSGWNILCDKKKDLNEYEIKRKLDYWLNLNYYNIGLEYQYKKIKPLIICETYLTNNKSNPLIDYKLFCFNGLVKYIQVDIDRFTNHTRKFYDTNWNVQPFSTLYPRSSKNLEKPSCLNEMIEIANILSCEFHFLRVDLYYYEGKIYFGELTFHHGGGYEPFHPSEYDRILGQELKINYNVPNKC